MGFLMSLFLGALILYIFFLAVRFTYWSRKKIPSMKGTIPPLGHMIPVLTMRKNFSDVIYDGYMDNKDSSMVGLFNVQTPVLMVRDPALVKTVMLSNFSSFHQNQVSVDPEIDPLLSKNPFFCYGEEWSNGRKRLTYAFSSMRLKILFETVHHVTKKFEAYLDRNLQSGGKFEVELKNLFSKFTGEVVANAGLGIEGLCFEEKKNPSSFDSIGKLLFDPNLRNSFGVILLFFVPSMYKLFKLSFIPKKVDTFFRHLVREVFEERQKESGPPRKDFFQLMIDMERTKEEKLNEETLASHALSFFVDGYETSSITLSFVGFHLAKYLDVQQKLREEIVSTLARHDGVLTYEALKEMTYMDQVINESQRMYPVIGFLYKKCTQECELEGSDGLRCRVKPGMEVIIPLSGLHRDPKYWIDPDTFDPERFGETRKQDVEKMTFLPFGEGPRICVGMRMALLQMKACLASLLRNYSLELSPKTQLPLKLSPAYFLAAPIGGLWVNIRKI